MYVYFQRQVEVSHVMEGYMQVLIGSDMNSEDERENQMQLSMIGKLYVRISKVKSLLQVNFCLSVCLFITPMIGELCLHQGSKMPLTNNFVLSVCLSFH